MLAYDTMLKQYGGDIRKFYDVPSLKEFEKSQGSAQPKLKAGYTRSSAHMSGEGVGKLVYAQNPRKVIVSKGIRNNYPKYGMSQGTYIYKTPVAKPAPAPAPAAAPAPSPPPKPKPVPIKLSKEAATAIGRASAYENTVRPQYGDYLIGGDESVIDDFEKSVTEKIEEASKLYFDDDVNRQDAQEYADKYKLKLGDDLTLTPIV